MGGSRSAVVSLRDTWRGHQKWAAAESGKAMGFGCFGDASFFGGMA